MGLQTKPGYAALESDGVTPFQHPVELDRNLLKAMFTRSGCMRWNDGQITPTGTNQQISIAAGRFVVLGNESAQQGGYFAWSDGADLKTFGAPSGSPRIDTLLLRIYDPQYGTLPSGSTRVQWDIVAGVPGATPAARPDSDFTVGGSQYVPGAWMKWAEVRINPGDTTVPSGQIYMPGTVVSGTGVNWLPRLVRVPGGIVIASTHVGGVRPSDPQIGDRLYEFDTDKDWYYNGTAWVWARPRGIVGGTQYNGTGNFVTGLSTTEALANMSTGTLSLEANRRFLFKCRVRPIFNNGAWILWRIRETNVSGTIRGVHRQMENGGVSSGTDQGYTFEIPYETGTAPGPINYVLTAQSSGGTPNITITGGGATDPSYIEVWDIGPAGSSTPAAGKVTQLSTP